VSPRKKSARRSFFASIDPHVGDVRGLGLLYGVELSKTKLLTNLSERTKHREEFDSPVSTKCAYLSTQGCVDGLRAITSFSRAFHGFPEESALIAHALQSALAKCLHLDTLSGRSVSSLSAGVFLWRTK